MKRRVSATLLAAAVTTTVLCTTAATASAAQPTADDGCVASYHPPARMVVTDAGSNAYTYASVSYSAACTEWDQYAYLSWAAPGPGSTTANVSVANEYCGSPLIAEDFLFLGVPPALGKLTFTGHGVSECDNHTITENSPTTDARLVSYASAKAARAGGVVAVSAHATRLWTSTNKVGAYAGAVGTILSSTDGITWKPLKAIRTGATGTYTYRYHTNARLHYRVLIPDASWVWGRQSTATGSV